MSKNITLQIAAPSFRWVSAFRCNLLEKCTKITTWHGQYKSTEKHIHTYTYIHTDS